MSIFTRPVVATFLFSLATVLIVYQAYLSFSYGFVFRPLARELGLNTNLSSVISAAFMLAGAILQVPAGFLLDRFSTARVLAIAVAVCAAGTGLLAMADGIGLAILSRVLMGAGAAFAFVGAQKLLSIAVSEGRFLLAVGSWHLVHSFLVAGSVMVTSEIGLVHDWRGLMGSLAIVGLVLAVLLWAAHSLPAPYAPPVPRLRATGVDGEAGTGIRQVLINRRVFLAALFFGLTFGPFLAYTDLWVIPHERAWGHSKAQAADIAGMLPIGMGTGSFIVGALAGWLGRPRLVGFFMAIAGLLVSLYLLFGPRMPVWEVYLLTYLFGFCCGVSILAVGYVRHVVPLAVGTALGAVTTVGYLSATVLQVSTGTILDIDRNSRAPGLYDFAYGLLPLPICFGLAIVIICFLGPTRRERSSG